MSSPPAVAAELTSNRIPALRVVVSVVFEILVRIVDCDLGTVEDVYD